MENSFNPRVIADEFTPELFRKNYLATSKPMIFTNCLNKFPISKWTIDHLVKHVGDNKVMVRGKTNAQDYKVGIYFMSLVWISFGKFC